MGEPYNAVHAFHGPDVGGGGDVGGGDDRVSGTAASLGSGVVSSGSLCSSRSSLTDDDEATSTPEGGPKSSSSLSSSDSMRLDGDDGPLYELSPLLAHLPQDRAVQVLPREVPVLHINIRCHMRRRPSKEDHPLQQQDEGVQRLHCCRARHEPAFTLYPRATQQDDSQEDAEGFI